MTDHEQSNDSVSIPLEAVSVPVVISREHDGTIIAVNRPLTELVGRSAREVAGMTKLRLDLLPDDGFRTAMINELAADRDPREWEIGLERDDGRVAYVHASARRAIVRGESCIVTTIFDVTPRKRVEDELALALDHEKSAREQAETVNRRLEFLLNASAVLTESIDYESRLRRLAEIAVPTIADWCAVDMLVLYTSGYANSVLLGMGIEPTKNLILQKPPRADRLLTMIRKLFDEASITETSRT